MALLNRRRGDDIPVSLETVRRRVMLAVMAVERETSIFGERYLQHGESTAGWISSIEKLCQRDNKRFSDLDDFKDVDHIITKHRGDPDVSHSPAYGPVKRMCERGRMFEYISYSLKNELQECYEKQLRKYCLSFSAEGNGEELQSVLNYENKIIALDKEIGEKFEVLNGILDEENKYERPLSAYINAYERVMVLMEDVCKAMVDICDPMKRWVMADAIYAKKVQDEINMYNRRKMDMRDIIKQLEYQRDQVGLKLKRRAFQTIKVERQLGEARDEKRYFKRRENLVKDNYIKTEQEINDKRYELDEVRGRIRNRKENSYTVFNFLTSTAEALRDNIRVLEGKLETMRIQMEALRREQMGVQKEVDRLNAEMERMNKLHQTAQATLEQHEHDLKLVQHDVKNMDNRITALKRIREIKLHSDTVKKIYHYGYNPGQPMENRDTLEAAFKVTAADVGKDWVWLYQRLPFVPPRDYKTRTHDIEVIDLSQRRAPDGDFKLLAMKSLQKWRRLSQGASVQDLMATLRRIKKKETARRIEKQLLNAAQG